MSRPPLWQLPPGVASGTWEYTHSPKIANDYDRFLDGSSICRIDQHLVRQSLPPVATNEKTLVVDLGCGTGRTLVPLAKAGYGAIGIDLSQTMLQRCRERASREQVAVATIHANLVQLEGVKDASVDHAVCLFSTLGMIRGRKNRRLMLGHVARMLRPGGIFVVHVHNRWAALTGPGGLRWLIVSAWKGWRRPDWEFGDHIYPYRGLPDMFLHIFSRRELRDDLQHAGFTIKAVHALTRRADGLLRGPRWLDSLRAGGFIAVVEKATKE